MNTDPLAELHRHDRRCYWDHIRCAWVCPPPNTHEAIAAATSDRHIRPTSGADREMGLLPSDRSPERDQPTPFRDVADVGRVTGGGEIDVKPPPAPSAP